MRTTTMDKANEQASLWLEDVAGELSRDGQHAWHALRAVLHVLRDRLTHDESAHLAAQLPLMLRGLYYEGWRPSETPRRIRDKGEFLAAIENHWELEPIQPAVLADAVFKMLDQRVSRGEIEDVRQLLPEKIRELWPQPTEA